MVDSQNDLTCPICSELFNQAVETPCCGTGYCASCLEDSLRLSTHGTCPSCRKNLTIFDCKSNKMVQRMVDNLPAECIYPGCGAKITRSIRTEHIKNCQFRPQKNNSELICNKHNKPNTFFCTQDQLWVCSFCYLVGSHRHHECTPKSLMESIERIAAVKVISENIESEAKINPVELLNIKSQPKSLYIPQANVSSSSTFLQNANNVSEFDEYEQLKKRYKTENFNFEGIQLKVLPICSKILKGTKNHVFVLFEIRVGKKEKLEETRQPFSLSLVLDRSGSMSGSKLITAIRSICEVIENMGPKDAINFVTYDDRAQIVFADGTIKDKNNLQSQVQQINAGGGTVIADGLQKGWDAFNKNDSRIKKIFLFSDGQDNDITRINSLCENIYENGAGISSFGIGSDFDEKMMKMISVSGHGSYFFIDGTPGSFSKILDKAFKGLSRTVATNVVLKIRGSKNRKVTKIRVNDDLFQGIILGDMREQDLKQVLLEVEVEENEAIANTDIFSYELSYDCLDQHIPKGPLTGTLTMPVTTDDYASFSKFDSDVIVSVKLHDCAELDKKVVNLLNQSNLYEAILVKRQVIQVLESVLPFDQLGFASAVLLKAKQRLQDLEMAIKKPAHVNLDKMKKEAHKDALEEEESDMGFGLFD